MCGRYVAATRPDVLARYFDATVAEGSVMPDPSYNVAPTNEVWIVRTTDEGRRLEICRWGLVPSWAKDERIGSKMINARAETVFDKPAFRALVRSRRCVVPADGFYEWQAIPGQRAKQPMYIHRRDGMPLAIAGLWTTWRDPASPPEAPRLHTVTLLTTEANDTVAPVHDRMPVILDAAGVDRWLSPGPGEARTLAGVLVPAGRDVLTMHPVSTNVNRVSRKDAALIDPIDVEGSSLAESPSEGGR
jgi:putative SOS response-associated peptidase YedK